MENRPREKSTTMQIVQTILLSAILVIMILIGIFGIRGFISIQKNMVLIEKDLQELDMDQINATIGSLEKAAGSLGQVDIDAINSVISSLSKTGENLEAITSALGSLFGGGSR